MSDHIKKKIGLFSVVSISVSGIIGSGWLFTAYIGAKEAGSGVFISWFIVLIFFILMALVLSEIVSMFPIRGLIGRLGVLSHNRFFGAIFAFAIWLELVGSMPGEAQASVQYLASLSPSISHHLMNGDTLSLTGLFVTFLFLVFYWVVNIFGIKFFAKVNNTITVLKLVVPLVTAFVILYFSFNPVNFTAFKDEIMPYGINSVFMAITTAGMIYVFNGFQLCTSFASEIKNPFKTIPLGMIISIILCFFIYILLQVSFMGALNQHELAAKGWHVLNFDSPFVQLASLLGLNLMAIIIYAGAVAAPTGTGITFVGSASRILYGMSKEKQMPHQFSKLDPKLNFSKSAMVFNFAVTLVFLALFHSWSVLILFITDLIVLMYMVVPVSLIGLRNGNPDLKRHFTLPFAKPICYLLFIVQAMFFAYVGAHDMFYLSIALTVFMIVFIFINIPKHGKYGLKEITFVSSPFIIYLWVMALIIFIGPKEFGGISIINTAAMFISITIVSIICLYYITRKTFITKCQIMREHDNVKVDLYNSN